MLFFACALLLFASSSAYATTLSIKGRNFYIDGNVTYPGTTIEGLLMNSRMIQGVFDDENSETVHYWKYPDTHVWDPDRNTREFVGNFSVYVNNGLKAVTVGLQGGGPFYSVPQTWIVSAFHSNGSLKPEWARRLNTVITEADKAGLVVIVCFFYVDQIHRLHNDAAVKTAITEITAFLKSTGKKNLMIDIMNECNLNPSMEYSSLHPNVIYKYIEQIQAACDIPVTSSSIGDVHGHKDEIRSNTPANDILDHNNYVLIHGNSLSDKGLTKLIDYVLHNSFYKGQPIVINEDGTHIDKLNTAVEHHTSWGYYDQGKGDYNSGFQQPPVNWGISTPTKKGFFDRVKQLAQL